ncbi:MAG: 2-oxoacid:acceptor oxidoreductase family protein [Blautia sp.]
MIDPQLVTEITRPVRNTFELPATQIAVDLGNRMAANMVVLGFLSESLGLIKREDLLEVIKENVAERFVELNFRAVDAGIAYAREHNLYVRQ